MAENENVTTKLQVDVTDLKKGLSEANRYIRLANSEFEKATAGAGKFADSTDGLKAKLTQLEKTLEGQEAAASVLRHEYERVCKEQGENSAGAQELAIKLNKQEAACKKTAAQISKYEADLADMEDNADEAGDELKKLDDNLDDVAGSAKKAGKAAESSGKKMSSSFGKAAAAAGKFAKKAASIGGKAIVAGFKGVAAAAGTLVTAFLATGETSKEWIGQMNKLETVAQGAGKSTEAVKAQFTEFYGILGDETAAATTTSNLEAIGLSQKNLASVTNSMAGIWSKYGDSIPLDGLAESINETSQVGQVTGNLADALNWAGISEDKFNEKLAACSSEQERQQLIVDTLDGAYGELGKSYKENNAAIIDSNKANAALQDSLAGVGEVAMPIMTTLKMLGASMLNDLLPGVKGLGEAFQGLLNGEKGAAEKLGSALSGILSTVVDKIVDMAPAVIQAGVALIRSLADSLTTMGPELIQTAIQIITDGATALIGLIPQLVTLGIDLMVALLNGITSAIPQIVQAFIGMIPQLVQALVTGIPQLIQGAVQLLLAIVDAIPQIITPLLAALPQIIMALINGLVAAIPQLIQGAIQFLLAIVNAIPQIIPPLIAAIPQIITTLINGLLGAIPQLIQGAIQLLMAIVDAIPVIIQALIAALPDIITTIINGLLDSIPVLLEGAIQLFMALIQAIPTICMELLKAIPQLITAIFQGLAALPAKLGEFFTGAWEGIKKVFSNVGGWFKDKFNEGAENAKAAWNTAKEWAGNAWGKVKSGFGNVGGWFKDQFTQAWNNIKNVFSKVGSFFSGIWSGIKDTFSKLGTKIADSMSDSVKSGINGVISSVEGVINKAIGMINGAIGLINKLPGVSVGKVSKVSFPRLAKGGVLERGQVGILEGSGAEAVVPLENNRKWISAVAKDLKRAFDSGDGIITQNPLSPQSNPRGVTYNYYQYNSSPKALSRAEIYRQTKNQLRFATQG